MKPSIPLPISISLLTLLTTSAAFPLIPRRQNLAPRASYSVVAVDGGSSTAASPTPEPTTIISTATDLLTHTQTLMRTELSTVVVTQGASPTTIIVTVTSASATTVVETPPPNTQFVTQTPSAPAPAVTTVKESPTTVTVTSQKMVAPSTKPYDDGSWHTTYFYTVTTPAAGASAASSPAPSSAPPSSQNPSPAPAPEAPAPAAGGFDDGSWAKWAGQGNGGQWRGPPKA